MRKSKQPAGIAEYRLCLLLMRGAAHADVRKEVLEIVAGPFQWPRLMKLAHKYGIAPLLYHNLESLGFPGVPEATRAELGNYPLRECDSQ